MGQVAAVETRRDQTVAEKGEQQFVSDDRAMLASRSCRSETLLAAEFWVIPSHCHTGQEEPLSPWWQ
jgi:hypothetical protein